jgi:hypothetical protein
MMKTLGAILALLGYIPAVILALRSGIFQKIYASIVDTAAGGSRLELMAAGPSFLSTLFRAFWDGGWLSVGFIGCGIIGSAGIMILLDERR